MNRVTRAEPVPYRFDYSTQLTHAAPTYSFYIGKEGSSLVPKRVEDSKDVFGFLNNIFYEVENK